MYDGRSSSGKTATLWRSEESVVSREPTPEFPACRWQPCRRHCRSMSQSFRSGEPMMTFGPELEIRSWNTALERLTGISADEAIGRPCWEVVGGVDDAGMVCHTGCSQIRLAREGWPILCPLRRWCPATRSGSSCWPGTR